jgi:palmitoyltransferase
VQKSGEAVMAWNVFKFCTALRALGSIMIVLVLGIIGVTYYVIVVANYGPALFHGGLDSFVALLVLVLFHSLVSYIFLFFFFESLVFLLAITDVLWLL